MQFEQSLCCGHGPLLLLNAEASPLSFALFLGMNSSDQVCSSLIGPFLDPWEGHSSLIIYPSCLQIQIRIKYPPWTLSIKNLQNTFCSYSSSISNQLHLFIPHLLHLLLRLFSLPTDQDSLKQFKFLTSHCQKSKRDPFPSQIFVAVFHATKFYAHPVPIISSC